MTSTPNISPDLLAQASKLVKQFHECFWFWHPETRVENAEDVRLVIENLRTYGGHRAWWAAQELHQCLLPHYKKMS